MTNSHPFKVGRIYRDEHDDAAILADGKKFRVSTMMRDSNDAQLSDAEIQMQDHIARDSAWRQSTAANRPGYRLIDTEAVREGRQKLADEYAAYEKRITTAYRDVGEFTGGPDSEMNVGQGSPARRVGGEQIEGSACMTADKRVGRLQRNAAGELECVADISHEDTRTIDQRMADHAEHMRDLYARYQDSVQNAYKTLR